MKRGDGRAGWDLLLAILVLSPVLQSVWNVCRSLYERRRFPKERTDTDKEGEGGKEHELERQIKSSNQDGQYHSPRLEMLQKGLKSPCKKLPVNRSPKESDLHSALISWHWGGRTAGRALRSPAHAESARNQTNQRAERPDSRIFTCKVPRPVSRS